MKNNIINLFKQKITGLSKSQLFLSPELNSSQNEILEKYVSRYKSGEPLEYILNNAEFYSIDFYVDSRVLIPRHDTEIMVDEVLKLDFEHLIDVGTGSGAIPITINKNKKIKSTTVIDIEKKALEVAKINFLNHKIKTDFINSSLLDNIKDLKNNTVITANLPYIKDNDLDNVDKETALYEPDSALYGGKNTGFELYEILINQILEKKGSSKITLFIEIGFDQKIYAHNYLKNKNLKFQVFKDSGNIDRSIKIEF